MNQQIQIKQRHTKFAEFIPSIVSKLGTCFATPEEEVIAQDEVSTDMYFLSKGDCAVNITDQYGQDHYCIRLLDEGDFFGEIGMIYGCKRTATVVSRNYNTFSRIAYIQYREVVNEFPDFKNAMKINVFSYKDVFAIFLRELVMQLPYVSEKRE
jgi:CRP-like cAMP-binding protein